MSLDDEAPAIPGSKLYRGLLFPEGEWEMIKWMETSKHARDVDGKPTYQYKKLETAVNICRAAGRLGTAIDCGGHVGMWSMHLAKAFDRVHAFEPHPLHCRLFKANVPEKNVLLYQCALADKPGRMTLQWDSGVTGATHLRANGNGPEVPVAPLDAYDLEPDLVKIDVEGYELPLLLGAERTLTKWSPIIVIEQKGVEQRNYGRRLNEAIPWLEARGWRSVQCISGDHIMIRKAR